MCCVWAGHQTVGPTPTGGVWTSHADSSHLLTRQTSTDTTSSICPVNNPALVYGRWEDDIIWDTEAVDHIPRPVVPRLDPNDPNVILGIPEEPMASPSADKEGKKVSMQWSQPTIGLRV